MTSCYMTTDQKLYRGQRVNALNGDYSFVHQFDGNVVLYRTKDAAVPWSTNTWGKKTTHLVIDSCGEFILYNDNEVVWKLDYSTLKAQQTDGKCTTVLMEDNGSITFKTSTGDMLGYVGDPEDVATGTFDHSKILVGAALPIGGSIFTHGRGGVMNFTSDGDIQFFNKNGDRKALGVSGGKYLIMQDDGNLVFYGDSQRAICSFNSFGYGAKGAKGAMILENGNLVLINDVNATTDDYEKYTLKVLFDFDKF